IIILAVTAKLPEWLAYGYGAIIEHLNLFIEWVSEQEGFILDGISFGLEAVCAYYLLFLLFLNLNHRKSFQNVLLIFLAVIGIQTRTIINFNERNRSFMVFHKSRYSIIGWQSNQLLEVHHNINSNTIEKQGIVLDYKIGANIEDLRSDCIQNFYSIADHRLLVIDSAGIYDLQDINPDLILLRGSPQVNLNRLIDRLNPDLIISDGSNYRSYQDRWEASCRVKKIPFHRTDKKGAFIMSY
ncbi:MAG: ComEC family competence protein, partial [Bacteroidia bacterium]|nr:ComEC family competence protein [Bacteroidia bacterium]